MIVLLFSVVSFVILKDPHNKTLRSDVSGTGFAFLKRQIAWDGKGVALLGQWNMPSQLMSKEV